MSISRKRLNPEESRSVALEAARRILLADGPQAVTLKAVAAEIGRTHANLLHHFGSAAGLQSELARSIAEQVTERIAPVVERARAGETDARDIVDMTFDATYPGKHRTGDVTLHIRACVSAVIPTVGTFDIATKRGTTNSSSRVTPTPATTAMTAG